MVMQIKLVVVVFLKGRFPSFIGTLPRLIEALALALVLFRSFPHEYYIP